MPRTHAALIAATLSLAAVGQAHAAFVVTYEAPGVTVSTATFDYVGMETFDAIKQSGKGNGQDFSSSFGTAVDALGVDHGVVGRYSDAILLGHDQYGGAGGSGQYAVAGLGRSAQYQINLTQTGTDGINYFGFWLSALDAGNTVEFRASGTSLFTFSAGDVLGLISDKPDYYGNPSTAYDGRNRHEPYVFLNFFYYGGTFDQIVFTQGPGTAGYESDNHTVGRFTEASGTIVAPVSAVPEPASLALLALGLGGLGLSRRRRT